MNDNKTVLVIVLLLLLWLAMRERSSAASSKDQLAGGAAASPTFGTDHAANAALATSSAPLVAVPPAPPGPAPRSLAQIQSDLAVQLKNPAYQAAAANPDIAASNAYNQQFIGKIT